MKIKVITSLTVVLIFLILTSFISTKRNIVLGLDLNKSTIEWYARKVGGRHNGFISILSGTLITENNKLTGGKFVVDTKSMTDADLKFKKANKWLMGHLKNNFFEVNKYPTASFEITTVIPNRDKYEVTGKMTIKNITKEIKFPAIIIITDSSITATATIKIDRRDFGINYGAGIIKRLANKAIYNEFSLAVTLVSKT